MLLKTSWGEDKLLIFFIVILFYPSQIKFPSQWIIFVWVSSYGLNLNQFKRFFFFLISRKTDYRWQFDNPSWPNYQNDPYHKLTHTILRIICKDTAWLAAIKEQLICLKIVLCLNGESGILFLMTTILNYETLLLIPAVQQVSFIEKKKK